eukprot:TRINITY_DN2481_c0_g1_i1.p1 TRINITY_DN2481_c0_g1~~TRINITY_DN2481_c0_g1_i1.p1  ORF type:complete len:172 (+),score=58.58 TRINITY_DN2481_c0_g1_i1:71-517(+)
MSNNNKKYKYSCPNCSVDLKMYYISYTEVLFMCKKCNFPLDSERMDDYIKTLARPLNNNNNNTLKTQPTNNTNTTITTSLEESVLNSLVNDALDNNNGTILSSSSGSSIMDELDNFLLDSGHPDSPLQTGFDISVKEVAKQLMEGDIK